MHPSGMPLVTEGAKCANQGANLPQNPLVSVRPASAHVPLCAFRGACVLRLQPTAPAFGHEQETAPAALPRLRANAAILAALRPSCGAVGSLARQSRAVAGGVRVGCGAWRDRSGGKGDPARRGEDVLAPGVCCESGRTGRASGQADAGPCPKPGDTPCGTTALMQRGPGPIARQALNHAPPGKF